MAFSIVREGLPEALAEVPALHTATTATRFASQDFAILRRRKWRVVVVVEPKREVLVYPTNREPLETLSHS
jgi:hypothetical protein